MKQFITNIRNLFLLICMTALYSCVGSRVLKLDQSLYGGASVKIHSDTVIKNKKKLTGTLNDQLYPLPNSNMLGLPVKLWIYSAFGRKSNPKSFGRYISDNYGEKPVLIADVPVDEVATSLQTTLKASGYLDATVSSEIYRSKLFKHTKKITYHCTLHPPYHYRKILNAINDTDILARLSKDTSKTLIHPGDQYDLKELKDERERLDLILKNNGYFYFSPDYFIYLADSSVGSRLIDITLTIRKDVDTAALDPWYVSNVLIRDISLPDSVVTDTLNYKGVEFVTGPRLSPRLLQPLILFNRNELLTYEKYSITNKHLSSLDAFKYTNIDVTPDSSRNNYLFINIKLTPNKRKHFNAEADLVSKSNHFAGPGFLVSHLNRNLFGGGEDLMLKLNGNIEAWLTKDTIHTVGSYNYELRASAEMNIPRFWMIKRSLFPTRFIPYTHMKAEARYINQMQFYRMSFFRASYGYHWNETNFKHHELNILDITFQHRLKSTYRFDSLINMNSLLRQSFANQYIIESNYTYQYSLPKNDPRPFKTAYSFSVEAAGNLINALEHLAGKRKTGDEPLHFLGAAYSQFVRMTFDYRVYVKVINNDQIAFRVNTGIGIPYGNSRTMPNIKQYYLGGANSLRAFRFRSIGPGAFPSDSRGNSVFVNHTGDLQLEGNIENRFLIAKHFEFALFLDAGNVWLLSNDPLRPNGQFNKNTFYKQLAIGWGYGFRYVNEYFVVRIDVGVPIHSPNPMDHVSSMKPILNFAFGYPF